MKFTALFLAFLSAKSSALACSTLPNLDEVLPKLTSATEVHAALDQAWLLKDKIRIQMKKDYADGAYDQECSRLYRKSLSDLRVYEDRLASLGSSKGEETTKTAFLADNAQLKVSPGHSIHDLREDLQSGDLILSRGNAFTSSAIAHMGEEEQQFSHVSLVYKNPETQKIYTIEAHIEKGVLAKPLIANIKEKNMRGLIMRYQDPKVAHEAAEYMFHRAKKRSRTGFNIFYDFNMDMNDSTRLFCSEVVSHAFDVASKGAIQLPLFKSSLSSRNVGFQQSIQIFQKDSFLPSDLEVDPRFSIIAEWKDWSLMRDSHEKDAILRSMFQWMDHENYEFNQKHNPKAWIAKNVGYVFRRIPGLHLLVRSLMPLNMSRDMAGLFVVLDQVGKSIQAELDIAVQKEMDLNGGVLPTQEWMMNEIEKIKINDISAEKPKFHERFSAEAS